MEKLPTDTLVGKKVHFLGELCLIVAAKEPEDGGQQNKYLLQRGYGLSLWVPENVLAESFSPVLFESRIPSFVIVDHFYSEPDNVRSIALAQDYHTDLKFFKGKRSDVRALFPSVKEEFERLLGVRITDWLQQSANGVFQITSWNDPLVWHSDSQSYAAAIYLTPNAPVTAGTSFWKDKKYGARRHPSHTMEKGRSVYGTGSEEAITAAALDMFSDYNLLHPDNWELVDRVGGIYNRLVIWDAKLIHSASSYENMGEQPQDARLVQLFFFSIATR